MSRRISGLNRILATVVVFPLAAQHKELEPLNVLVGGGLSVALNPTGKYVGVSGNATAGMGVNFDKHDSIEGDFLWSGLSPNISLVHPINRPTGNVNLYTVTANYRFRVDSLAGSKFGFYVIGGGGLVLSPHRYQQEICGSTLYGLSAHLQLVGIRLRQ